MEKEKQIGEFKPFVSADRVVPEFTAMSIIIGVFLAVLFGAANAYLGLKVGMTVSAHMNTAGNVKIAPAASDSPAEPMV